MNGVCVRFRGWVDLDRLDGVGCVEYDEERGGIEEAILKGEMERYAARMREVEENQRIYKERQAAFEADVSTNHEQQRAHIFNLMHMHKLLLVAEKATSLIIML